MDILSKLLQDSWNRYLGNEEYARMFVDIVDAVENVPMPVEHPQFVASFAFVKQELINAAKILVKEKGHVLTLNINKVHADRKEAITSFYDYVYAGQKHPDSEVKAASIILARNLKKFGKWWIEGAQDLVTQRINQIVEEQDANEELTNAAKTAMVVKQLEVVKRLQSEYVLLRMQRTIILTGEDLTKVDSSKLRNSTWDTMRSFLRVLKLLKKFENVPNLDFVIGAIDKVTGRANTIVLQRLKLRANAKSKNENGETASEPKVAKMMHTPNASEADNKMIKIFDNGSEDANASANPSVESDGNAKSHVSNTNHVDGAASEQMPQAGGASEVKNRGDLNNAV